MDKCDNCTIRYVCEGQHEFNCMNNNYKYYNPESKTADSGFPKFNSSIETEDNIVDVKYVINIVEDNKTKMVECVDCLWIDNMELNKTSVKRLINSLCKNIIKDIEKQFNNKVEEE